MAPDEIEAVRAFLRALAEGNLSCAYDGKGPLAGELKSLQANLRHLNWQVQQVANGDLNQSVDCMGDFSQAFNQMIANLRSARQALQESEELYRLLAENTGDVIWLLDPDFKLTYLSPSLTLVTGYLPEEALGKTIQEFMSRGKLLELHEALRKVNDLMESGQRIERLDFEIGLERKNGELRWLETSLNGVYDEDGQFRGIRGVARDITGRRQMQAAEREQRILAEALADTAAALNNAHTLNEVLSSLLSNIGRVVPHDAIGIFLIDEHRVARMVAGSGWEQAGGLATKGRKQFCLPVDETPNIGTMARTGKPVRLEDVRESPWRRNPQTDWVRSYLGAPVLIKGDLAGFLGLYSGEVGFFTAEHAERLTNFANQAADAIEKAQLIEKLTQLSITDGLTGVFNRRHFMERVEVELERSRRYNYPLCAMMLDGDDFKKINDTYGHPAGDMVLREMSRMCRCKLRKSDLIGRYGGDELVVLLPNTTLTRARLVAERLRQAALHHVVAVDGEQIIATISIGVAEWRPEQESAAGLLTRADNALYIAKQHGKNRVAVEEVGKSS